MSWTLKSYCVTVKVNRRKQSKPKVPSSSQKLSWYHFSVRKKLKINFVVLVSGFQAKKFKRYPFPIVVTHLKISKCAGEV